MKIIFILINFAHTFITCTYAAELSIQPPQSEIIYEVHGNQSFADPETVDFRLSIINNSKNAMVIVSEGLEKIKLIGPDGQRVRPYPYHPSGRSSPSYVAECFPPGAKCDWEWRLSALFPFPTVGEYRCTFTRRVYQLGSADVLNGGDLFERDDYGKPFDVTAAEVIFRVEKPTSPDRPRQKVDPLNHIGEPGLEYNTMPTNEYPVRGERNFIGKKEKAAAALPYQAGESSRTANKTKAGEQVKQPEALTDSTGRSLYTWIFAGIAAVIAAVWACSVLKCRKAQERDQ